MVATKFYSGHDDEAPYVNWSECMNITPDNLLQMELTFLNAMDWKVYVSNEEFYDKVELLEQILARKQGINRGWFTYMELNSLLPSVQIAKQILQTTLIFGLSYTAFVATMVASVFLVSQIPGSYLNAASRARSSQSTIGVDQTQNHMNVGDASTMILASTTDNLITDSNQNGFIPNNLLDLTLNRLNDTFEPEIYENQLHRTKENVFSSWYSILQRNAFEWTVITNSLNQQTNNKQDIEAEYANEFSTDLFCNLTSPASIFAIQPNSERIKIDFNSIKMKFA